MVRGGEVEGHACDLLDICIAVELCPVVSRDRVASIRMSLDQLDGLGTGLFNCSGSDLSDLQVTAFAFHQADDAVPGTLAQHGVDFPMTDPATQLNVPRP